MNLRFLQLLGKAKGEGATAGQWGAFNRALASQLGVPQVVAIASFDLLIDFTLPAPVYTITPLVGRLFNMTYLGFTNVGPNVALVTHWQLNAPIPQNRRVENTSVSLTGFTNLAPVVPISLIVAAPADNLFDFAAIISDPPPVQGSPSVTVEYNAVIFETGRGVP